MGKKTLILSCIGLALTLVFFELTNVDFALQTKLWLAEEKAWFLKDPHKIYRAIFYHGIKIPIYIIGAFSFWGYYQASKKHKWEEYQKGFAIVALSLVILPLSIALVGKKVTNVNCPDDLKVFNADRPYAKLFDPYPPNPNSPDGKWQHGNCWPAGHASGGFALFSLVCFFKSRRNKRRAFWTAMITGHIMGFYQILKGSHFLSHHIVTMFLALILVSSLNLLIKDKFNESTSTEN